MAWYDGCLYVGTTRSNFQMLRVQATFKDMPIHLWPVNGPDDAEGLYRELDRRAQIWRYTPNDGVWDEVWRSPIVIGSEGDPVARDTGLRAMAVLHGASDRRTALYVATWAVSRSPGALLLRSFDGRYFEPITPYGIIDGLPITATRVLVPFKDKLYTSPTGVRGHSVKFMINVSGYPVIFENPDPSGRGKWVQISESGFGEPGNLAYFPSRPATTASTLALSTTKGSRFGERSAKAILLIDGKRC